jgi:D-alanine-D-alanine ligase
VLVERFLSGREFTVGITGTGNNASVTGTMEILLNERAEKDVYSYLNKEECDSYVEYKAPEREIAERCEKVALDAWRMLECQDGGRVDIRCDEKGEPNFIEVNPLAGLHPVHSDLPILSRLNGISYPELIERIMSSALEKLK